ncbi:beta-lactamase-like protein [Colletotrichum godetiae]|uniref:Beta-lactamase-like protein n=1 Tax=Colletotrichum godetiae TaxID=1209918 RepID=A0AAJ0ENM3_9PEZI|nr:beta-lactamase-like protein [Colletotrichum godetiae]KAK1658741.1 beta-lactamase-like protein [Colletotrichum godetiae]
MGDTAHNLPCPSGASVTVSVLNNCFLRGVPTAPYVEPIRPGHETFNDLPCLVFLIENSTGRKVLFDLGLRKDWEKLSPVSLTEIQNDKIHIVLEEDIVDILQRGGIEPGEIEAVVLSHHHWDHVGDLSLFPETTRVVIGPGFLEAFRLGYPDDALAPLLASDFSGTSVDEINFEKPNCIPVGPFTAFDYFGDGSFYLIDAPGHSIGHIGAIARTTSNPDTFIFMGADSCHHCGEFRPSERRPTPCDFGLSSPTSLPSAPCSRPTSDQRKDPPRGLCGTPFYSVTRDPRYAEYTHNHDAADETIVKVQEMDGYDNVFVIMAHDDSIPRIVDIFPKHINQWKSQKWNETGRWTFLSDWSTFDLAGAKVGS